MAKAGFGEHLKREREMRGISLDEISSATRIAVRFLEAMENEQWDQLPGGVFNRGFVRAVAHHLGLSEEALIAEYTVATGDQPTGSSAPIRTPATQDPSTPWLPWVIVVALIAVILAGAFYGWRRYEAHKKAQQAAPPVSLRLHPRTTRVKLAQNRIAPRTLKRT
jgi:cytoskeleton protein RodZ